MFLWCRRGKYGSPVSVCHWRAPSVASLAKDIVVEVKDAVFEPSHYLSTASRMEKRGYIAEKAK